jgi:phage terminase large subunit-like protein
VSRSSTPSAAATLVDGWPPRWLTPIPIEDIERGDGDHCAQFIENLCRITKDSVAGVAGSPIILRPWQLETVRHLLARRSDGRYRHRQALIGIARKNGKSALGAGLALYSLVMGSDGSEVYSCAGDRDQARIVFGTAKRMVELEPELSGLCKLYRDAIEVPETGSIYRVLSAEAYTKEGLNPTAVYFDEVHVQPNRELWDVMSLAMGARVEPIMVGITTAGVRFDSSGSDSLCYGMYEHGKRVAAGEVADPSFFFAWWEPQNPTSDHKLPETWEEANPGFGDIVSAEDFEAAVLRTPEAEFRTKRCNQWVTSAETWLPHGAWDALADGHDIPAGESVVLGFDGSFNGDSTALVAVSVADKPHIQVVEAWERPSAAGDDWQVPILDVESIIRNACRRWQVVEIACDPFRWARTYQILEGEGLPIVEFPQSPARMTPATTRFYESVMNRSISHSGDVRLARHIGNAVLKADSRGTRIYKEHRNSTRRIDLAVAAVMALDRAAWHAAAVEPDSEPWAVWLDA